MHNANMLLKLLPAITILVMSAVMARALSIGTAPAGAPGVQIVTKLNS